MRAALIPPKGYYETALQSDYMLALAQIDESDYYQTFMFDIDDNAHLILDNGAAEGKLVDPQVLWYQARRYDCEELVVPDIMGDMQASIDLAKKFMSGWDTQDKSSYMKPMFVLQGQAFSEIRHCADTYAFNYPNSTFALPRHLLTTLGNHEARIILSEWLRKDFPTHEIHWLGTNPTWVDEIKYGSNARGVDSSLPYNYTMVGIELDKWKKHGVVRRPADYFTMNWKLPKDLLEHNIQVYLDWARGA